MAAGGSESPGPHLSPGEGHWSDTGQPGRPLLRLPEGREVNVLPGLVSKEAWGVCGASPDVSSAVTGKSC